jgi:hypothetical protein
MARSVNRAHVVPCFRYAAGTKRFMMSRIPVTKALIYRSCVPHIRYAIA